MEIGEWETGLDSYDGIVTALETHSETLRNMMDKKQTLIEDRMSNLKTRLADLANGTVSLELLSKGMVAQLDGVARAGEGTSYNAAHLRKLFTGDIRESNKLAQVATDEAVAALKCKDCQNSGIVSAVTGGSDEEKKKEESGCTWSSSMQALVMLSLGVMFW